MRDWNYRHQTAGVENAGPRSYGMPKHLVVAAHRKSSVQLFVGSTNVVTVSFNTMPVLVTILILMVMRCAWTWFPFMYNVTGCSQWSETHETHRYMAHIMQ